MSSPSIILYKNLIKHCSQYGYLTSKALDARSEDVSSTLPDVSSMLPLSYTYGFLTSTLFYNLKHEWLKSLIRNTCGLYNIYWLDQQAPSTFESIIQKQEAYKKSKVTTYAIAWSENKISQPPSENLSSLLRLVQQDQSKDDYLNLRGVQLNSQKINLQRLTNERLRWWKKFLNKRESLLRVSDKCQLLIKYNVDKINASYCLESLITSDDEKCIDLSLNMNYALSVLLIDAFKDDSILQLHPLLAPYQVGIQLDEIQDSNTDDYNELRDYLGNILTSKYQFRFLRDNNGDWDKLGVPFVIILNSDSLKNGLCTVQNRDTRLREQVHIKHLPRHLSIYFKALDDYS